MANETNTDVNLAEASSSSADATAATSQTTAATVDKQPDSKEPQTMADVAAKVAEKHGIELEEKSASEKSAEGDVQKLNETQKKEGQEGEDKKEDVLAEGKDKTEEGEKAKSTDEEVEGKGGKHPETVPYSRFKEVNDKANTFEERYTSVEPVVKAHQDIVSYCQESKISDKQFGDLLKMGRLMNENPTEAVKVLTTLVEQIQGFVGDKLPEDLQKKVDEGKMELDDAKAWAAERAKIRLAESKEKFSQQQAEKEQEQKYLRDVHQATDAWETRIGKTDPDFREGSEKYNLVLDKYVSLSSARDDKGNFVNPIRTVDDHIALFQKAYVAVDGYISKLSKSAKPNGHKVLSSTTSSVTAEIEPKSMQEIARKVGAKHGIAV